MPALCHVKPVPLMENKYLHIRNPLTVVGIFAGFTEVFGTWVLPNVAEPLQSRLLWFLIIFPFFLVLVFFGTLWVKHEVLYAPSDFPNPNDFLKLLKRNRTWPWFGRKAAAKQVSAGAPAAQAEDTKPAKVTDPKLADRSDTPEPESPQQKVEPGSLATNLQLEKFVRSERGINSIAKRLKAQFSCPYALGQSPKNWPDLVFDIVLTGSEWNSVGKIAAVTDDNWQDFLKEAHVWLNKLYAFRESLETKDAMRLQGLFCLVYSPDSISEDSLAKLQIELNGIQLQYPFSSFFQLFNVDDLQA